MFTNIFCNILTQTLASGTISAQLQTFNASANVNLTLSATGLTAGLTPSQCAYSIITQFNQDLTNYGIQYSTPQTTGEIPAALFRLSRTEHVVNFFSECQFDLTIITNDTSAYVEISDKPYLSTLSQFQSMVGLINFGASLTDEQYLLLLKTASGLITSYTQNLIVLAGYVQSFNGFYQRSFFLSTGLPVQSYDSPRIATPNLGLESTWYVWTLVCPWMRWNLTPETGELFYQPNQNLLNYPEPSSLGYQIKISYTAGNWKIPPAVLLALTQIGKAIINDPGSVKEIKTGSFSTTFRDRSAITSALQLLDDLKL